MSLRSSLCVCVSFSLCLKLPNACLLTYPSEHGKEKLDLLMLFSVTMWLHIHHGDQGLTDILTRLTASAGTAPAIDELELSRTLTRKGEKEW